ARRPVAIAARPRATTHTHANHPAPCVRARSIPSQQAPQARTTALTHARQRHTREPTPTREARTFHAANKPTTAATVATNSAAPPPILAPSPDSSVALDTRSKATPNAAMPAHPIATRDVICPVCSTMVTSLSATKPMVARGVLDNGDDSDREDLEDDGVGE